MTKVALHELDAVRETVADAVPAYFIKQLDPIAALADERSGQRRGNCFAKAVLASGLIVMRHGLEPSVVFSERLHATPKPGMLSDTHSKNYGHISVLVATTTEAGDQISSLCFGIDGKSGAKFMEADRGDILDYNEEDNYATVDLATGLIQPTDLALEMGLHISPWSKGTAEYLGRLGLPPVNQDALFEALREHGLVGADKVA